MLDNLRSNYQVESSDIAGVALNEVPCVAGMILAHGEGDARRVTVNTQKLHFGKLLSERCCQVCPGSAAYIQNTFWAKIANCPGDKFQTLPEAVNGFTHVCTLSTTTRN